MHSEKRISGGRRYNYHGRRYQARHGHEANNAAASTISAAQLVNIAALFTGGPSFYEH